MIAFWKKAAKAEGISCVIRAKNEADWVRLSIISILDFADEIIFVDNGSTDGTLELVRELKDGWGLDKLKLFTFPPIDGQKIKTHLLYNFAFGQATKTWVFKWDADFIARTNQLYSIMELKELWGEFRDRADVFRLSAPNLFGDHLHFLYNPPDNVEFCFERYLFRNRRWKHRMATQYENLVLKAHRRHLHLGPPANPDDRRVYFYHLKGLKPDENIVERASLSDWWNYCQSDASPKMGYEQWLCEFWGTADRNEQIKRALEIFFQEGRVRRFEKAGGDWGEYPSLMKPYLERPRYEIVCQDGKPRRRVTHLDRGIPLPRKG